MFEYHVHNCSNRDDLQSVMNKHAREGWRLHTCTESTYGHMLLVFERQLVRMQGDDGKYYHGPG